MPIHPDAITAATLRRRWRGYDRRQVQALLHRLGQDYTAAIDTIAELSDHPDQAGGTCGSLPAGAVRDLPAAGAGGPRSDPPEPASPPNSLPAAHYTVGVGNVDPEAAAAAFTPQVGQAPDPAAASDTDNMRRQPSERPRPDDTTPSTPPRTGRRAPAGTSGEQRVQEIEAELVRLRARLSLMERISDLEDELAALRSPHASQATPAPGVT